MPRPLKQGIVGASTIILSKDIDKYAFMCGSNFYETDVRNWSKNVKKNAQVPWSLFFQKFIETFLTPFQSFQHCRQSTLDRSNLQYCHNPGVFLTIAHNHSEIVVDFMEHFFVIESTSLRRAFHFHLLLIGFQINPFSLGSIQIVQNIIQIC